MTKTNVMRLLEQAGIEYESGEYTVESEEDIGIHAADAIGMPREQVFKTLVARGAKGAVYVFCIPVEASLHLKKAAKAAGDKSIEMIHVKEILGLTGYIRGGCSPIGMKKKYPTYFDETAMLFDRIAVSAGQRGCQIMADPEKLKDYVGALYADLTE